MKFNSLIIILILVSCLCSMGQEMEFFDPKVAAKEQAKKDARRALLTSASYKHWLAEYKKNFKLPAKGTQVRLYLVNGKSITGEFKEVLGNNVVLKQSKYATSQIEKERLTPVTQRKYFVDEYAPYYAEKKAVTEKAKGDLDDARTSDRDADDKKGIAYDIAKGLKTLLLDTVGKEVQVSALPYKMSSVVKIGMKATKDGKGYISSIAYLEGDMLGVETVGDKTVRHAMDMSKKQYEEPVFYPVKGYIFLPHVYVKDKDTGKPKLKSVGEIKVSRVLAGKMFKQNITMKDFKKYVTRDGTLTLDPMIVEEEEE